MLGRGGDRGGVVEPVSLLAWNVKHVVMPKSARTSQGARVWSARDNKEAVQAEVLRLSPGVVAVREWSFAAPAARLEAGNSFLGAKSGHAVEAVFVHVYPKNFCSATA